MIITSKFNKKGLVNDLSLFLLTVLGMVTFASVSGQELVTTIVLAGILLAIAKGSVRDSSLVIGLSCATIFFLLSIAALYPCKQITIWRGNLEVKHLLWPFKVKYYSLDEFDYSLEIITKSQYSQEESLWLMREGKLSVSTSQTVYSNYDALEHAIGIIPSDTIEMSSIKKIPYYFGKTFNG